MKKTFLMLLCTILLYNGCSSDKDSDIEKKIEVNVYESLSSKASGFYSPKTWSYFNIMLFATQTSNIDNNDYSQLKNGVIKLKNGETLEATYKNDTGIIYDVPYGEYTLLVYCTENPFNAYLENRYMYKLLNYSESNATIKFECCFVYEDMATTGGWQEWFEK